jgi:hypothetical protein
MKSKKKTKKPKFKKIQKEMDKVTKRKPTSKQIKEIKKTLKNVSERENAKNPDAGSKFEDFMRLEQEGFGLTTEQCDCTPERGCLERLPTQAEIGTPPLNSTEQPQTLADKLLSIFGFKRSK